MNNINFILSITNVQSKFTCILLSSNTAQNTSGDFAPKNPKSTNQVVMTVA